MRKIDENKLLNLFGCKLKHLVKTAFCVSILIFSGCEKINDSSDKGNVTFGVNTHVINCAATAEVFVDNKSIGIIPGFCDSIVDCISSTTLNKELSIGKHTYKIEVNCSGSYLVKEGDFELKKGDCVKIFMDLRKQE